MRRGVFKLDFIVGTLVFTLAFMIVIGNFLSSFSFSSSQTESKVARQKAESVLASFIKSSNFETGGLAKEDILAPRPVPNVLDPEKVKILTVGLDEDGNGSIDVFPIPYMDEDVNKNGTLDAGEDRNGNGTLDQGIKSILNLEEQYDFRLQIIVEGGIVVEYGKTIPLNVSVLRLERPVVYTKLMLNKDGEATSQDVISRFVLYFWGG
jgi:hypothetical protein